MGILPYVRGGCCKAMRDTAILLREQSDAAAAELKVFGKLVLIVVTVCLGKC